MLSIKQINDINVKPPRDLGQYKDMRPPRYHQLFNIANPNVFIVAKKFAGKTCTLFNILKKSISRKTQVLFFVPTINSDATYLSMKDWLDRKGIIHHDYTDIVDEDGTDNLKLLVDSLKQIAEERDMDFFKI